MTCDRFDAGGVTFIACSRGQRKPRCKCGKTCDAKLCSSCATEVGPDRHYCGPHARIGQKELGL